MLLRVVATYTPAHHKTAMNVAQLLMALFVVGEEEAEVAEVVAGGSGDDGVSQGGEHGAGVEVGEGRFEVESEGVGAGDGGGVGYGSC